jgi:predicted  nucleic acid-binding Zn-ribbon protein
MRALQALDAQRSALLKRRSALEAEAKAHQSAAQAGRAQAKGLDQAREQRVKQARALEMELKAKEGELKRLEAQANDVRSDAAAKAITQELATMKAACSGLEDRLLTAMEAEEGLTAQALQKQAALEAQAQAEDVAADLSLAQAAAVGPELGQLDQKRAVDLAALGPDQAVIYERFLKANRGQVVAVISGGSCGNCKVKVPVHLEADVRKARAFHYCVNCGVMLAVAEAVPEPAAGAGA